MYLPEPTLVQRAQDGDSTSCLDLGKHYFYSTLIKDNFQQAFDWIRRSAEQGHPDAQFWVADLYSLGHGTQQSNTNAYEYYTMAALQGCENALIRLRRIYHDEIMIQCPDILNKEEERFISKIFRDTPYGTRKLYDSRITHIWPDLAENSLISYFCEMFKKCKYADMLNEGNRTKLAFLYHYGYGVVKDVEQAVELYTEAANRGCMDAQYHLACLYQSEMTEYEKSLRWYAAAAHGGHIAAQKHLDYLSRQGFKLDGRFLFDQSKWMDSKASGECTDILDQSGSDIITERYKSFTNTIYLISTSTREILYTKLKQDVSIINKSATLELANQAMDGDKSAIYLVGMNYYHASDGFPCRQYTGCQWILLAAKLGIDDAQLFIGEIYKQQGPFEQNYFRASLWFNRAKQNKAKFQLGLLYEMGFGVSHSHTKAYKLLTKNVDDDNLFRLGLFYFCNRYREAVSVFETCVKRGNIEAVDRLRCMYLNGYDHDKNPQMALKLLEYAADRGHTRSQVALARLYTRHRNPAKSVEYYFLAAKGGDPHAQYQIAMRYLSGECVGQNYAKAFEFIQASARQGHTRANKILTVPANINQYIMEPAILNMFLYVMEHDLGHVECNIGCIYEERGRWHLGTESARLNITNAIHWYTLSANQNNVDAQYRLGLLFEKGKAIEADLPRASSYYRMAIASGHCEATLALACMYINGRGVDQDFITAYRLFSDAANMGHREANDIIHFKCYKMKAEHTMYRSHYNATVKISDTLNMQMVEAAGSQNHAVQYRLGKYFEYRELTRALLWYEKAGKGGIHDAYFCLGVKYEEGVGDVTQDFLKAIQMYRLCVNRASAIYRLGQMYQFGRGVKQDYTQAYHLYKKAVDIEDDIIFKILNRKKKDNIELKSRFKYCTSEKIHDSISMWEYLAQQGDTQAQYELAYAYHLGFEEPRFPECIKWYSMASAHPDAIQTLGYFHEKGLGGFTQDTQKAIHLYEKARKLGNVESVFRMGEVYYNGTGIEQDCLKGLLLYIEAARDGSIDARNRICYLYSNGDISAENKAYQDIHCQSTYDAYRDYVF